MPDEPMPEERGLALFGPSGARVATSLDLNLPENKRLVLKCLQDCQKRITEEVGETIVVTDYFLHDVECRNKDTGEVTVAPRMVLIDKAGVTHECVSETLVGSLRNVSFVHGQPPWPKGIKLTPRMKRKGERNIYFFEVP